jgi:hypothetical protein
LGEYVFWNGLLSKIVEHNIGNVLIKVLRTKQMIDVMLSSPELEPTMLRDASIDA